MNWFNASMRAPQHGEHDACAHVSREQLIDLRLHAGDLRLGSRKPVATHTTGIHHSRFRGRGVDYQESRAYQAGDDIRAMDWRVMARRNEPYTKLFHEERERPVWLLADFSPSLFFGTRRAFKSVLLAQTAAMIAWATIAKGDRIGALLGNTQQLKPCGGRRGVLRLIRALVEATEPEQGLQGASALGLSELLMRQQRAIRPGSLVFILSDFYALDDDSRRHLSRLRQHNDVVAIQFSDVLELSMPPPGRYGINDGKQQGFIDTQSRLGRNAYQHFFSAHQQAVDTLMQSTMTPLLRLITTDEVTTVLRSGLRTLSVPSVAEAPEQLITQEAA